jgi:S1-C subfamily serine protease
VDGQKIQQSNELQERVARKRPGDNVQLTVNRAGKEKQISVTLGGLGTEETATVLARLGVSAEDMEQSELEKMGLDHGVRITQVLPGKVSQQTGLREGFILTHIDRQPVKDKKALVRILEEKSGGVMVEGMYPDRRGKQYYAFGLEG